MRFAIASTWASTGVVALSTPEQVLVLAPGAGVGTGGVGAVLGWEHTFTHASLAGSAPVVPCGTTVHFFSL